MSAWVEERAVPLELNAEGPDRLSGIHRGEKLVIAQLPRGCRIAIAHRAVLAPRFLIRRQQGPGLRDERGPDLIVGDPALDPLLQIQSAHPSAAIRMLQQRMLKTALLDAFARHSPEISRSEISLELSEDDLGSIRAALPPLTRLAIALREAAEAEVRTHELARREAREEPVFLPSQRFVHGKNGARPGRARRWRRVALGANLLSVGTFIAMIATMHFRNASEEGVLFAVLLGSLAAGPLCMIFGVRCDHCGTAPEEFPAPYRPWVTCEGCGRRY